MEKKISINKIPTDENFLKSHPEIIDQVPAKFITRDVILNIFEKHPKYIFKLPTCKPFYKILRQKIAERPAIIKYIPENCLPQDIKVFLENNLPQYKTLISSKLIKKQITKSEPNPAKRKKHKKNKKIKKIVNEKELEQIKWYLKIKKGEIQLEDIPIEYLNKTIINYIIENHPESIKQLQTLCILTQEDYTKFFNIHKNHSTLNDIPNNFRTFEMYNYYKNLDNKKVIQIDDHISFSDNRLEDHAYKWYN